MFITNMRRFLKMSEENLNENAVLEGPKGKRFCSGCGNELEEGIKFCPKCGKGTEENRTEQVFTASANMPKKNNAKKIAAAVIAAIAVIVFVFAVKGTGNGTLGVNETDVNLTAEDKVMVGKWKMKDCMLEGKTFNISTSNQIDGSMTFNSDFTGELEWTIEGEENNLDFKWEVRTDDDSDLLYLWMNGKLGGIYSYETDKLVFANVDSGEEFGVMLQKVK